MTDLQNLSLSAMATRLRDGSATATAIAEACLARVETREGTVGAWQHIDPERVLEQAARRDTEAPSSSLHGIPVGLKDIIDTEDMPTTYGSPIYAGHTPRKDAIMVQRLRAAGAVLMGKTVTTQFAHRFPGKTANPRNPAHTPGGSSSGSAAAVADDMTPLAFGTQTSGSVIRPAAYCGVIGFKPTFGWTDFTGAKNLAASLDTLGYYVRSLDDLPMVHAVLNSDALPGPETTDITAPNLALCRTPVWDQADECAQATVETTAERLSSAGAGIRKLDLDASFARVFDAQDTVLQYEMARHLKIERTENWDLIAPPTQDFIIRGEECSEEKIAEARYIFDQARTDFAKALGDDIAITLSAPGEAPKGLEATGNALFNRMWTALHVPCLHLPVETGPQGLPLGVTLVARKGHEQRLVAAGRWAATALDLPLFG